LQFRNGATLKFMSGGGSDKSRAGFTARVVVITETDGLDEIGGRSRESDKLTQLEARTRAYGHRKRIYMECTVSTETGRTWQEYTNGTKSRIVLPCPGCGLWVSPEREHLTGWQGAESQAAARATGTFACPACGQVWSEAERVQANQRCRLLHEGQSIGDDGCFVGAALATDTLGFRWSAVNNLLITGGDVAADEWKASQSTDEENAERAMRQFVWCLPIAPSKLQQVNLEVHQLSARTLDLPKGTAPAGIACVTVGIDCGKYLLHWIAVAWTHPGASGHILDYGRHEVASQDLGVEPALLAALRGLREELNAGWPSADATLAGQRVAPRMCFVDAGYMTPVVYAFCRESGGNYLPAVGRGASQQKDRSVNFQAQTGSIVKVVGEGYRAVWLPTEQVQLVEADADHWKTWVHQRLSTPVGTAGAMTLYKARDPHEHLALAKHLTAEAKTEEFVTGKGVVVKWEKLRRQNHFLDALYNACVAAHGVGVRLVQEQVPQPQPRPARPRPRREDDDYDNRWIRMTAEERRAWVSGYRRW
jgi:phage terminase large subunit GpA-like protein